MQNICLFYTVSQILKVLLIKSYMIQPVLLFLVVLIWLLYTSADMTFYKFLELHLPLPKKIFCHKFYFFNGFTQTPPPT